MRVPTGMSPHQQHHNTALQDNFDVKSAATILILAFVHLVIYLSAGVIWCYGYFLNLGISINMGTDLDTLTIIVRMWNFYVYLSRINEFQIFLCQIMYSKA